MINIYDGNNYYRRLLEVDQSGMAARGVLVDMIKSLDVNIWVWDGEQGNSKRREKYPDYKANRKAVRTDIYAGFDVVREVLSHTPAFQISIPGYEGDDVIATLARRYASTGNQVAIFSTDYDFIQLTGQYKDRIFCGAKLKDHVTGNLVRHYKTWVGDTSDNIRGIPGFGDVTWQRTDKKIIQLATENLLASKPHYRYQELSKKVNDWLSMPENVTLFRTYWEIIGFYEVPETLLDKHLIVGKENYAAADRYLKEWMQ